MDRDAHEGYLPVEGARLHYRVVGEGPALIVLHGGPDFDTNYLLPELDRLASSYRLIYYDQRGRGRSAVGVQPAEVSMASEAADLDAVRAYFGLPKAALLGHSWGALLALEYAVRFPRQVSRLILLNPAPASRSDYLLLRREWAARAAGELEEMKAIATSNAYRQGDLAADAARYRIHFRRTLPDEVLLERLVSRLRAHFTPEGVVTAREIEDRLVAQTWQVEGYDLLPALSRLEIPTLVVSGKREFIPLECSQHIAQALDGARLVVLEDTGHFSYLENPVAVKLVIDAFMADSPGRRLRSR